MNTQTQESLKMAIEALDNACMKIEKWTKGGKWTAGKEALFKCKEALAQPAQEPVSLGDFDRMTKAECVDYIDYLRKEIDLLRFKEWQGLSDKEYMVLASNFTDDENMVVDEIGFARAIEKTLRIKNAIS